MSLGRSMGRRWVVKFQIWSALTNRLSFSPPSIDRNSRFLELEIKRNSLKNTILRCWWFCSWGSNALAPDSERQSREKNRFRPIPLAASPPRTPRDQNSQLRRLKQHSTDVYSVVCCEYFLRVTTIHFCIHELAHRTQYHSIFKN